MSEPETVAGLPVPPKEKVARWAAHGGVAALATVAVVTFMPYVNKALGLLLSGFWTVTQLGALAAAVLFGAFLLISVWPFYRRLVESFANRATWALFEYDPITPMMLWLKEVRADRSELETQYGEVDAVISQNEQTVSDNNQKAASADKRFAEAVRQFGPDSHEAQLSSLEPGTLRETADHIAEKTKALYAIRDILKEVLEATEFTEQKAELDVKAFQQEFSAAKSVERATSAANRVLKTRSQRKSDAMQAMQIIHDKYAGSFGRLQGLRQLSQDVITSVDMTKGTYHQEALERLRSESRLITGGKVAAPALEALPSGTLGGVPLYKVPKQAGAAKK